MRIFTEVLQLDTGSDISLFDITPEIKTVIEKSDIRNGFVLINSRHTTTAIIINEHEERLLEDIRRFLMQLVPKENKYLHNDIHLRDCPPDEPENAHSHLCAILLSSSESVPLANKQLIMGTYQSIILVDLDGPRQRTVSVQIIGE
ncbi:secondary thiamine-phosphate synthase enzyme YjbQ [Kaarinaea lacus]